jgi:hypothetical protein
MTEGQVNKNKLVQVKISTWTDFLKLREWKKRMINGRIDNWGNYEESLNPKGEKSYEDFCDEIDEGYYGRD